METNTTGVDDASINSDLNGNRILGSVYSCEGNNNGLNAGQIPDSGGEISPYLNRRRSDSYENSQVRRNGIPASSLGQMKPVFADLMFRMHSQDSYFDKTVGGGEDAFCLCSYCQQFVNTHINYIGSKKLSFFSHDEGGGVESLTDDLATTVMLSVKSGVDDASLISRALCSRDDLPPYWSFFVPTPYSSKYSGNHYGTPKPPVESNAALSPRHHSSSGEW